MRDRDPEPGVRAITTDLQYKKLREKSAAPPNTVPAEQPVVEEEEEPTPSPTFEPFDQAPIGPVQPPRSACPTAAPTETADEDVTSDVVKGTPKNGDYLWKVEGSFKYDEDTRFALPGFIKKKIENVKVEGKGEEREITFEVVEREIGAQSTVRSFFNVSPSGISVGRIERTDPKGTVSVFEPVDPIRYIVLPVQVSAERKWSDQSVDALSGEPQIFEQTAYVRGRMTIDACGERLRGWHVVAEQTYRKGSASITRHFEYAVATQFGGIVIFEDVRSPCTWDAEKERCNEADPADLEFKANIGSTEPE